MPLYEYECKKCGHRIEKIQKFSDSPLTTCQTCGGNLERLISSPAIQFKGTGWYVTDYGRSSASSSTSSHQSSVGSDGGDKKSPQPTATAEAANVSPNKA